ncbi:MAG: adenylosuccinate lyase [Bacteroidetes bacterium HGW-Bacteroidetes-13]|nr:MAG: adenylosuccinate lyase [Bacteroidetes bacterium HGW-Bacteroidetes-13]
MKQFHPLLSISPVDGRYHAKTYLLSDFFSEKALIKYRILVEIEYFIQLINQTSFFEKKLTLTEIVSLRNIYLNFSLEDALAVKEIEKTTNHDVKAVEYFIKQKFDELGFSQQKEWVHFGLTSQDINNTAIPLSLKEAFEKTYLPDLDLLIYRLQSFASEWKDIPMLARTHGQPASPTRLGKEIAVFVARLEAQKILLLQIPFSAKFGGATGNYNAHHVAFPEVDWKQFGTDFVENILGLSHSFPTTQIEHYDNLAAFCDALKRINTIVTDLDRDCWTYISMDYFKQKIKAGEIGSSAMPHKVNPIDFENSEGNLGIANALLEHFSAKLPISRLQRDLTDSTVLRNIGVPLAHIKIAFESTLKGLEKLVLNPDKIQQDLDENWAVVAEAIQTILRKHKYPNPYEALKNLTRTHQKITRESLAEFIDTLDIAENLKSELKQISPFNYTGI